MGSGTNRQTALCKLHDQADLFLMALRRCRLFNDSPIDSLEDLGRLAVCDREEILSCLEGDCSDCNSGNNAKGIFIERFKDLTHYDDFSEQEMEYAVVEKNEETGRSTYLAQIGTVQDFVEVRNIYY